MIDSQDEFIEPQGMAARWVIGAVAALLITAIVLVGYGYLRKRHAASIPLEAKVVPPEPRASPKALILVDDAMLEGGKTLVGGTVKNISAEKLGDVSVELELKRRKDGVAERKTILLQPSQLEPEQEGRYALELKAQEYGSARFVGLKSGPEMANLPFTTAPGKKRPPERLESKTITVGKRTSKPGEFLNSPENPARVP